MNKSGLSFSVPTSSGPKVAGNESAPPRIQRCHRPSDAGLPNSAEVFPVLPRFGRDGMDMEAGWMRDWLVISEETNLFPLLEKVLRIAMRRTEAIKGSILLGTDYGFSVRAEAKRAREEVSVVRSEVMEEKAHPLFSCILDHICRTRTPVVLNKPIDWHLLGLDPNGPERLPLSVLCWPFPHGPDLVGVLYLERNQGGRPFGDMELRFLSRLSPLVSVTLKNAIRVGALENRVHGLEKKNADLTGALAEQTRALRTLRESEDRSEKITPAPK